MFYKYYYPSSDLLDILSIYYIITINGNKIRNTIVKKLSNIENNKKILQDSECTCITLNLQFIHKDNSVIRVSITDPRATVKIIKGKPILNHRIKLIL